MGNLIKIEAEKDIVHIEYSPLKMAFNSFWSGLAWGVGSVLGATVVVTLLFFLVSQLDTAPIIGQYISNIIDYIQNSTTN
jgi:hypothetical protein